MSKTPCFLIARDRFTSLKNMVEYLVQIPELEVIILDNASTYGPLLEWYDTSPCVVHRLTANYGNFVLFSKPDAIEGHTKPDFKWLYNIDQGRQYILSDCDLDISSIPKDFLSVLKRGLEKYPNAVKCGFSLEINDLPDTEIAKEALGWERNNWVRNTKKGDVSNDIYISAPIDTTFALYTGIGEQNDFERCVRTDRPYTAKHLPWYFTKENLPDDERYFLQNITRDFTHYSFKLKNTIL
jgi:hypothetical protein